MLFVLNLILKEAALLLFRVFVMNLLISIILFLLIVESECRKNIQSVLVFSAPKTNWDPLPLIDLIILILYFLEISKVRSLESASTIIILLKYL